MENNKKILIKFTLYFLVLLLIIIIGISNVFAETYDAYEFSAQLYDNVNGSLSTVTTNFSNNYWVGTVPNMTANSSGGAWGISTPIPLIANHTYSMSIFISHECGNTILSSYNRIGVGSSLNNAKTSYQNNSSVNENLSQTFNSVSGQGLQFAFTPTINGSYLVFPFATSLTCSNVRFQLFNITIDDLGTSGISETTINNSLNNQTNSINNSITNSQNAITNNSNNNRDLIIQNQNENTDKQIESQKVCKDNTIDKNSIKIDNQYLLSNGNTSNNNDYGITDYYSIDENSVLTVLNGSYGNYCTYDNNKSLLSCYDPTNIASNTVITLNQNVKFIRFTIRKSVNSPRYNLYSCINGNQALNDSVNNLNDNINDDNTDGATSEASEFFSDFNTNTFGLTSIITAPLNLIQSLTSSTCTPLHLPLPYLNNKYLDLPCMSTIYSQHFGTFFTLYQTITYGIIAYWVCVRIFNHVKDFKNPEHDEIEVVDL